jgi:hypothetical protein
MQMATRSNLYFALPLLTAIACHVDGHYAGIDAGADTDADVDALPQHLGNDPATLVLGQPNFESAEPNAGGVSQRSLRYPYGIAADGASIWVGDAGNARVLRWQDPQTSFAPAAQVLGRSSFEDASDFTGATAVNLRGAAETAGIAVSGSKLLVADTTSNRVLVWNPLPTTNGQAASFVLGQLSPTCCSQPPAGNGAGQLGLPYGTWTDGTRVAVADRGNHRVLIWKTFPTTNGQPADLVLGQPGFGQADSVSPPTAASMKAPTAVYSDGTRLYVADTYNHRVLIWSSFPTTNGQPADLVIGQPTFAGSSAGSSKSELSGPRGMIHAGTRLYVADTDNHRVVIFDPLPATSGASAVGLFGQADFGADGLPPVATQASLKWPAALAISGSSLYVTDNFEHRVLRFGL